MEKAMTKAIRRIVTGHDANGKAMVLLDDAPMNVKVRKASGGLVSSLLWATDESPANVSGSQDRSIREIGVAPPRAGSVFRIVDFPPTDASSMNHEAVIREMGLEGHAAATEARHPLMHRTKSIDYVIVLQGEIDMLLDDSEVHLEAGDTLVQQGTNHAWVNRGRDACRIAFVLIDADEPAALRGSGRTT
jgi:mannose-6-phosphate isomerase-like protein (cupin superfamily)